MMIEISLKIEEINGYRQMITVPIKDVVEAINRNSRRAARMPEAVIDGMVIRCGEYENCIDCPRDSKEVACDQNEVVPAVHAKWEYKFFDSICSACGFVNKAEMGTRMRWDSPYCPKCGARMDAKETEHGKENDRP